MHSPCDADQLQTAEQASGYYDRRYAGDYMRDWPAAKLERVAGVVRSLGLGERGVAVDLGCGVGVFSRVLRDALPGWEVVGLEISPQAVESARRTHPDIDFRLIDQTDLASIQADFVFSHHVLEHVVDLAETWRQVRSLCGPGARVLHILPCGDAASLEHRLATRTRGGIDARRGGRFFYEDPGHLRRLTWHGLCNAAAPFGFKPIEARYANRFWGGLSWISKLAPDKAKAMARPGDATGAAERAELACWRIALTTLATMHRWARVRDWRRQNASGARGLAGRLLGWPTGIIGQAVCGVVDRLAEREWRRDASRTGSEMYAVVRLDAASGSARQQQPDAQQRAA